MKKRTPIETATAGLNAPAHKLPPTAKAPTRTVKPIAKPQKELPAVPFAVAVFNTTQQRAKVNRNSANNKPFKPNTVGQTTAIVPAAI